MTRGQVHSSESVFVSIWCGANVEGIAVDHDTLLNDLVSVKVLQNPGNCPLIYGIKNQNSLMRLRPSNRLILRLHSQLDYPAR
jgi:hypothetical protein